MLKIKTLKNGMQLVVDENNSPITSFGLLVKVGSFNENKDEEGVSHFIEHLMFKSTKNNSVEEIATKTAFLGTEANAYTSNTHTLYHFKSLTENFEKSLEIYADMLQNGIFNPREVNSEREVVLEEMSRAMDNPISVLFDKTNEALYSGTCYAHPVLGNEEVIKNISIEKIKNYIAKHYTPNNMVVSVSGGITMEQAEELIIKYFPNYFKEEHGVKQIDRTPVDIVVGDKYIVSFKDDNQVNIMVSIKGKNMFDKDHYIQTLYATILGGDMSSRLFLTLREKMGLAYSVSAFADAEINFGTVRMYIGTSKDKVSKALIGMRKIMLDMAKNGATELELQKAKNQIKAELMFGNETGENIMMSNATKLSTKGEILSNIELLDKIDSITVEDINRFAKEIFIQNEFVVCAVGKDIKKEDLRVFETCVKQREHKKSTTKSQEKESIK